LEAAIERSVTALDAACDAAERAAPRAAPDHDPLWLSTEMDRWVRMPARIREVSQYGQLHLPVYWDQVFELSVYPRNAFATLADVIAYYRQRSLDEAHHPSAAARWRMLRGPLWRPARGGAPIAVQRRAEQIERWRHVARSHRCVEHDGAVYIDLADLLRDALCRWTGHWTFDGVVLDRYAGDEIDYGHYLRRHFLAPEEAERFERFRDQLTAAGIHRETSWSLLSPSGERVWKLVAVFSMDGNSEAFLLESDGEFLDVFAAGS
jgi:hypothetical protein